MTKCPLCELLFVSRYNLAVHVASTHGFRLRSKGARRWRCLCGNVYKTADTLYRHLEFQPDLTRHILEATLDVIGDAQWE